MGLYALTAHINSVHPIAICLKRDAMKETVLDVFFDKSHAKPLLTLWMLRFLLKLGTVRKLMDDRGIHNNEVLEFLNLDYKNLDTNALSAQLKALYDDFESKADTILIPEPLATNIFHLKDSLTLNDTECNIIAFAVLMQSCPLLSDVADWYGTNLPTSKYMYALSMVLDKPETAIRQALSQQGILAKSNLVTVDDILDFSFSNRLDLLSRSFSDRMLNTPTTSDEWFKDLVITSPLPELTVNHYPHLSSTLPYLMSYLKNALKENSKGVNVLIHGVPGTGKTQLSRIIAKEIGYEMLEVAMSDAYGNPCSGSDRLRQFSVAQSIFKGSPSLMLFDDIDDIFSVADFSEHNSAAANRKAWLNNMLEINPMPTFWICNHPSELDASFIRRFDWILEVPVPPKTLRETIIRENCGHVINESTIKQLAQSTELAPAIVARVSKVVSSINHVYDTEELSKVTYGLIDSVLAVQGHQRLHKNTSTLPDYYNPVFINCDADLAHIATMLQHHDSARLCLFGPPGTGKSAYAYWLADQLEKPLHIKQGSDLLGKYVGETEQNIADVFNEAIQDKAILLIDEVDSFLQNRNQTQRSWEVSAVNEMLTQMEAHQGIFIASTNRMEGLDGAALRRFDLKVRFNALKTEQLWKLLISFCNSINLPTPQQRFYTQISAMTEVTPGDFAVLGRQHKFRPLTDIEAVIEALRKECAYKQPYAKNSMGFV